MNKISGLCRRAGLSDLRCSGRRMRDRVVILQFGERWSAFVGVLQSYYQDVYKCPVVELSGFSGRHGLQASILALSLIHI